jgi:hypothetical protein
MLNCARLDLSKVIGSLTLREKRAALGEIVRATGGSWRGIAITGADKLEAIALDNDLAGHGAAARAKVALARFLEKSPATHAEQIKALLQRR